MPPPHLPPRPTLTDQPSGEAPPSGGVASLSRAGLSVGKEVGEGQGERLGEDSDADELVEMFAEMRREESPETRRERSTGEWLT